MTRPTRSPGLAALARLTPVLVTVGCLALAAPAAAQQATARGPTGMRYLTWPGKVERPVIIPSPASGPAARDDRAPAPGPIMTFPDAPVRAATRYSARTSPGPTPASAWIAPRAAPTLYAPAPYAASPYPAPTYAPAPALLPEPPRDYARTAPIEPAPRPEPPAPRYAPPRVIERPMERPVERPAAADTGPAMSDSAPPPGPAPLPEPPMVAPVPIEPAPAAAPAEPAFDPMAPRRDAPIFRLLTPNRVPAEVPAAPEPPPARSAPAADETAPAPAPVAAPVPMADASTDRTPRYYSVHRANGQQPDRTPLPDPVYLDSAPVDLAEPPATPTVLRNPDGSVRAIVPNEDPTLP